MSDGSGGSELAALAAERDELARYADSQEQKVRQLQEALDSRVVIEQAVGMLAERFELNVQHAFELLRRAARESRGDLRALATRVTLSRVTPDEITVARASA